MHDFERDGNHLVWQSETEKQRGAGDRCSVWSLLYWGESSARGGGVENPMGMAILAANLARNSDRAAAWT